MQGIREGRPTRRTITTTPIRAGVVLVALAIVVGSAAFAFGALANNGTLTACVNKTTGAWRTLVSGTCAGTERQVRMYTKFGADEAFLAKTNCIGFPHEDIDWHGCDLTRANLSGQGMYGSNLANAYLGAVNFKDADLGATDLRGADLQVANLTNVSFAHANLTDALNMNLANLTNVYWQDTTCPDATNSDNNGGTCVGHL